MDVHTLKQEVTTTSVINKECSPLDDLEFLQLEDPEPPVFIKHEEILIEMQSAVQEGSELFLKILGRNLRRVELNRKRRKSIKSFVDLEQAVKKNKTKKLTNRLPFQHKHHQVRCLPFLQLQVHKRIHVGEAPFQCTFCDCKSFKKTNLNMTSHNCKDPRPIL